jgi:PucR family transcriptional regulator, purine catabolism regulatory protein
VPGVSAALESTPTYPTVAQTLRLPALKAGRPRVVAGRAGLDRPVRWTHVAELPDIAHLLRGGELLLTTGVALPEDDAALTAYVNELANVGASGLVVELGRRYQDALPEALVAAAEAVRLPLVELRRETPFVRVTEQVHAHIVDAQLEELRASDSLHRAFTELSVEGAAAPDIVRETARLAGRPVVLENLSHQVLAYDPAGADAVDVLDRWEARSRAVGAVGVGRTHVDERVGWLVTTIGARGHDFGRLVVVLDGPATSRQVMLVERAASALALSRLVDRDRESLERQSHRLLLDALVTHSLPAAEVALRAKALGVPTDDRMLVGVVLRRRHAPGTAVLEAQARLRDLAETAAAAVREARLLALVGPLDDASVGVLVSSRSRERADRAVERLATTLRRLVVEAGDDADDVVMAVGSSVDSVRDVRRSLVEAGHVAAAAIGHPGRPFYRLPDLRLDGLLQMLRDDERLQTYVERELGALLRHDAERGTDLLSALRAYLDNGRNKSAAADASHLSRPSFYERLHRIEAVLGVDLDSVSSCLSLHVALLALDAIRSGE